MSITCKHCGKELGSEKALHDHTRSKHFTAVKDPWLNARRKKRALVLLISVVVIVGLGYGLYTASQAKTLPPVTMEGHIEVSPSSHILKQPMRLEIQKHMLEHVDGEDGARGGVIINYDCQNYQCDDTLIENLEQFAIDYDYVYVAPWKNMKNMIALTRAGQIRTLDNYNEELIRRFVEQ